MNNDLQTLIIDSTGKIFTDHVDKSVLDAAEGGKFQSALWQQITDAGFHLLAHQDSGAELIDAFTMLRIAGQFAVPLPLAETVLANRWLENSNEDVISIGEVIDGGAKNVPWSSAAQRVLAMDNTGVLYEIHAEHVEADRNIAFEPRDRVFGKAKKVAEIIDGYELLALSRANLSVGALQRVLEMTIQYVGEREQFGRPIAKFQAVQHNLAVAAAEVAAATRATDGANEALETERFPYELAAAKSRVGESVTIVNEIVHQLHGAMGFTHEHILHHYTRRLWSWREEYGHETYWQAFLGYYLVELGADRVWDFIATDK